MALFRVEMEKGFKTVMFASANNGNVYVLDGNNSKIVYEASLIY